ncbi:hypothetical protein [Clostridium manihotivorum]|uniref:HPr kinase/phosphorylase n=1 Tax=Clostridium manihotivorum TaxID=2320868 RepID=A0A3R5QX56_9CLOT|nr:hypothetical protein [Clostridium manihotivorum]QAA34722.1 hypothetical protein C1I91_25520 [Clostridium manihotivorum]
MLLRDNYKKNYYRVYGLNVKSEVVLPELINISETEDLEVDIEVTYGSMNEEILESLEKGITHGFIANEMWFSIDNIATYYIYDGKNIVVEPFEAAESEHVKAFLLGSAFGMLLYQRDLIAIHGGTIVIDGKAVIFTGDTGAGKSTLTAALRQRGYRFMADDVSVLRDISKDGIVIHPAYPQQKLCRDTINKLGGSHTDFRKLNDDRDKYIIPVQDSFYKEPLKLGALVELSVGDNASLEISEVLGSEKLITLMKNIYRIEISQFTGISRKYFRDCVQVAKEIPIYKVVRPKGENTIDEIISILENKLIKDEKVI